ncbi:hypothetical protein [Psychromicrobium xiongbiense]|uniref:hypothetical protein n=1 Tax=Psychromicrobium xiongbiense TaxID=3051184 RepID=UPI002556D6B4|nr:hypothetical protein [Psychromicrobium sp. YIM S02556]
MAKTPAQRAKKHGDKAVPGTFPLAHHALAGQAPGMQSAGSSQQTPQQTRNNAHLIIIAGVVASAFMFWYYHVLTLNQMTQLSHGLAMPDSLLGGFDTGYLSSLHDAMDDAARGQLQYVHKTAGTLFPLIFGLTWLLLIGVTVRRRTLRWVLWSFPIAFALVQLVANILVDAAVSPAAPDAALTGWASALVVLSWLLLLFSVLAAGVALLSSRLPGWLRQTSAETSAPTS